jgi:hypothetical protein
MDLTEVLDLYKELMKKANEDTELFDEIAKLVKNMHEAFIRAGFTEEQSFSLLIAVSQNLKNSK